jgi:hypothetical protein
MQNKASRQEEKIMRARINANARCKIIKAHIKFHFIIIIIFQLSTRYISMFVLQNELRFAFN